MRLEGIQSISVSFTMARKSFRGIKKLTSCLAFTAPPELCGAMDGLAAPLPVLTLLLAILSLLVPECE